MIGNRINNTTKVHIAGRANLTRTELVYLFDILSEESFACIFHILDSRPTLLGSLHLADNRRSVKVTLARMRNGSH